MAGKLRNFVDRQRKSWLLLMQATAWVGAVIASFLLPPPVGTADEAKVWVRFAQFVITILIGLLFLLALRRSRRKDSVAWAGGTALFLVAGTICFFAYQILAMRWTATYNNERVIIGGVHTAQAAEYRQKNPTLTSADLLMHYAGQVEKIWTAESLNERRLLLAGIYVLTMPLFTTCIISLLQAIHCATFERKPRKRRSESKPDAALPLSQD